MIYYNVYKYIIHYHGQFILLGKLAKYIYVIFSAFTVNGGNILHKEDVLVAMDYLRKYKTENNNNYIDVNIEYSSGLENPNLTI